MKTQRIQLSRKKGWRKPENTVVVSRPTKWGNPFNWQDCDDSLPDREKKRLATLDYKNWLTKSKWEIYFTERRQWILDHVHELRGKNLACWCKLDEPCHADVLLKLANNVAPNKANGADG